MYHEAKCLTAIHVYYYYFDPWQHMIQVESKNYNIERWAWLSVLAVKIRQAVN